ncbi:MAG: DUF3108 domain-containing protein [Desulfobulbaceae bacterium]|uniref:DUF3108 domain-containing protein n=1 Tax=Candidatus Desulfobia pelagia TaxID=2841692 RepID=A0A8J6NDT6_9BACT|nr:DUF3108 domain-containing protein [Candidatus Desulfobia pelagia]
MGMMNLLSCLVVAVIMGFWSPLSGYAEVLPFSVGEKLTYELKWGIVPAGEASLEVLSGENDGLEGYHFRMTAKSNSFVDVFYMVRDVVDGYTDLAVSHSLLYKKSQNEGSTRRDIVVAFNWEENTAQYSNFGKSEPPIPISDGSFDPFSVIYYCRLFDFSTGQDIIRPVTDGKKAVLGVAWFKGRKTISINGTTYDAFLIEPEIEHISGVFKKSKKAKIQIWLTADERRIPLRIKSKVAVGSFVADLVDGGL